MQYEDGSSWTHGMVVGKGDHNHHDRSYVIQLINNGRHISRKRWHIKPTTVTAGTFLQHQSKKLYKRTTDPLTEILNNINSNPALYASEQATSTNNTCHQYEEQNATKHVQKEADIEQYHKKAEDSQEKGRTDIGANCDQVQENKVIWTDSGCIVKKLGRLIYTQ